MNSVAIGLSNTTFTIHNPLNTMENIQALQGKKVKVIGAGSGHGIPMGTAGKVIRTVNGNQLYIEGYPNTYLLRTDVELVPITAVEIDAEIVKLEAEIERLKDQKIFMSENGLNEYDETQFKVFRTLATLEKKDLSSIEKSKLIAKLITG